MDAGACGWTRRRSALAAAALCLPPLAAIYQLAALNLAAAGGAAVSWQDGFGRIAATPWTAALLVAEAASFALWMLVLGELPLSVAFPLTALGSVASLALAALVYGTIVPTLSWAGIAAILAGAWLIARPRR